MTKEIKIGHIYRNDWGDERVAIFAEFRDVRYIENRKGDNLWHYNPYMHRVSKTQFLLKFKIVAVNNPLTSKEIDAIEDEITKADNKWSKLLVEAGFNINRILAKKIKCIKQPNQ